MLHLALLLAGLILASYLLRRHSPRVYDAIILHMTSLWYSTVIDALPEGSKVLDVGMGTGTSLLSCRKEIEEKHLSFTGVDFTEVYVQAATAKFKEAGADAFLSCKYGSVYDEELLASLAPRSLFDAVYVRASERGEHKEETGGRGCNLRRGAKERGRV
jgi:2-polyprenyl-3-methyl-5-hydroxy-6-metoxy-1,4-benzoquinol methylase